MMRASLGRMQLKWLLLMACVNLGYLTYGKTKGGRTVLSLADIPVAPKVNARSSALYILVPNYSLESRF